MRGKKQIPYKRAAPLLQKICFHQIDGWERREHLTLFTSFFLFRPLSAVSPVVSPNSSSCTIPTTGEVAIQTTSDGAEERAIVSEGLTLLLSIDWKGEKGKITSIDYHTGQGGLARTSGGVRKDGILRPTAVRTTTDIFSALSPFYCPHFNSLLDFRQRPSAPSVSPVAPCRFLSALSEMYSQGQQQVLSSFKHSLRHSF